ncbi:MAG: NAD(P)/FAD-dependent oxidoreductase [Clostridia bacterium]|nr:NAD(P)/FAD-dependent oxidoreductase [Clostridia bacterium]MBR2613184.1 NAD(P)/FAD-dependent oxidoreductase [Clostridia bacterium]
MSDLTNAGVAVIGGGAAGLMAAYSAARYGARVTLFERNDRCGRKLAITGKGRCNVTNDCSVEELLQNVPTNPRFLYSALGRFDTSDTKAFFEERGVALKVERGRRVFPVSDRAEDIVRALVGACKETGVNICYERVTSLRIENGELLGLNTEKNSYDADAVIICTGGKSYPRTGSDGDGYALARSAGHTVTPLLPSLVPICSESKLCPSLQGLSLKNVSLSIVRKQDGKEVYSDFGEMMFTHFGLTGPMILSASAHIPDISEGKYEARINLKPALDEKTLDARIISDFSKYSNKDFLNALGDLLPQKLIPVIVSLSGIDARKKVNSITKEERRALCEVIRCLRIPLSRFRPINEAIITKGGVSVKEISPKTMESKLCRGLYFAGEVIDVDAYTGGYNLQIAFSSAVLAGESAAVFAQE